LNGLYDVAFKELKRSLISSPVLTFPKEDGQFILNTDASSHGIGGSSVSNSGRSGESDSLLK